MKKCPCDKCDVQPECAWNNWCLFNSDYEECPNRQEGLKQYKEFVESEKRRFLDD